MKYKPALNMDDLPDAGREWNVRPRDAEELMQYRASVLDSEEYKEAQKYLEDYQDAYEAKENIGLFDEMELAEKYWSGDFGVPEDFDDPGSNTNIINTNIETQVASMMDQTIDIEIKPYDPSDRDYVKQARMILDRIKDLNQLPKKIEDWERKKDKFGTGIFRVMFNKKLIDKIGCPEIKVISPAYVYPDPNITNIDEIQESRFMIEVMPKSLYWAEQKFGKEKAWAIAPGYNPAESMIFDERGIDMKEDHYLHILYWCRKDGKLRLIQMSGCGVILSDSSLDSTFNYFTDDAKYPYFFTVDMRREGTIWGKSVCSLLFSLQDEIDDYTNQIRRNARLTGNPIKLVADTSGVDIDKLDNTAGQTIPVRDINGVKYLTPPNMATYIVERRSQAMNERVIVSRISDQQSGIKQAGVSTATESLSLAQSASVATDARKTMLQYTLNDVFNYCFDLALNYWNIGMFFESGDDFEYFKPSDLLKIPVKKPSTVAYQNRFRALNPDAEVPKFMLNSKEKRRIKLIFDIQVGAGLPQNKAVAFNYILEAFKGGLMSKQECRELMIEYIHLPVSMGTNEVIELEKEQIAYERAMLESQIANLQNPQPVQQPTQYQQQGLQQMQNTPNQTQTVVQNPRPDTVNKLNNDNRIL